MYMKSRSKTIIRSHCSYHMCFLCDQSARSQILPNIGKIESKIGDLTSIPSPYHKLFRRSVRGVHIDCVQRFVRGGKIDLGPREAFVQRIICGVHVLLVMNHEQNASIISIVVHCTIRETHTHVVEEVSR